MFYKTYLVLRSPFLLPAATKLGQGNVFTGVCGSVNTGGGSASVHAGIPTQWEQTPPKSRHHLGPDQTPLGPDPPGADPLGADPPGADTPPGLDQTPPRTRHPPGTRPPREQTPQKQTPPREADSRIRSTSGR